MKIFIGHDSRYPEATNVCRKSIENYSKDHEIITLDRAKLIEDGIYGREPVHGESTEFSFTRFYVPLLSNFQGISIFCDNDFLWKCDPIEIEQYLLNNSVSVVKADVKRIYPNKMDGITNKAYPKKFWSSLMLFNNSYLKNLNKEYLDNAKPKDLHEFFWTNDEEIGEIPLSYNYLVGYYDFEDPKVLHYTQGGPWFEKYKNGELSEEWYKIYETL